MRTLAIMVDCCTEFKYEKEQVYEMHSLLSSICIYIYIYMIKIGSLKSSNYRTSINFANFFFLCHTYKVRKSIKFPFNPEISSFLYGKGHKFDHFLVRYIDFLISVTVSCKWYLIYFLFIYLTQKTEISWYTVHKGNLIHCSSRTKLIT